MNQMSNIKVHKNLNKRGMFSVLSHEPDNKGRKRWIVKGHWDNALLLNCTPVVSKSGSARVKKEQERNVHAFLKASLGYPTSLNDTPDELIRDIGWAEIYYDPYVQDEFTVCGFPYEGSQVVRIIQWKAFTALPHGIYQGMETREGKLKPYLYRLERGERIRCNLKGEKHKFGFIPISKRMEVQA